MNLENATVVVTGASSGIGRATALEFAKAGANLVLASRSVKALKSVADQCREMGVQTRVLKMDITRADEVQKVAEAAVQAFNGRIDVWVNDPGVGVVGEFEKIPVENHRRVIETNLIGYVNGTHAVLPIFKNQNAGIVINLNSLGAFLPSPYGISYTASKFGLFGFTEALRGELRNFPEIHICDLFPGFVSSPGVSHGANYSGVDLKPVKPLISPERVARNVVALAKKPSAKHLLGSVAWASRIGYALFPQFAVNTVARFMEFHFKNGYPATNTDGILFEPTPANSKVNGEFDFSFQNKVIAGLGLGAVALAGFVGWKLSSSKSKLSQLAFVSQREILPSTRNTAHSVS